VEKAILQSLILELMGGKGVKHLVESLQAIGILPIELENFTIYQNIINEAIEIENESICPVCKTSEAEAIQNREITGLSTMLEYEAYEKGRSDEQKLTLYHLREMDFNNPPKSTLGKLIKEKLTPPF
jgi:hypothetical protein